MNPTASITPKPMASASAKCLIQYWSVPDRPISASTKPISKETVQIKLFPCISVIASLLDTASHLAASHQALFGSGTNGIKYSQNRPSHPSVERQNATACTWKVSDLPTTIKPPMPHVSNGNNRSGMWTPNRIRLKNPPRTVVITLPFFLFGLWLVSYLREQNSVLTIPIGLLFVACTIFFTISIFFWSCSH
jgi:hypothetical protein